MEYIKRCIQDILKYWNACWKIVVLATGIVCMIAVIIHFYHRRNKAEEVTDPKFLYKLIVLICDSVYLTYSFYITFGMRYIGERREVQWIPFVDVCNRLWEIPLLIENILLFIPFGVLAPLTSRRLQNGIRVLAGAAIGSLGIEVLQYVFQCGKTEIDDVILNCLGAMIGYAVFFSFRKINSSLKKRKN